MKIKDAATALAIGLVLGACTSSGYKEFYTALEPIEQVTQTRASPAPKAPELIRAAEASEAVSQFVRKGFVPIGYSSFSSGMGEADRSAIKQGAAVGAD